MLRPLYQYMAVLVFCCFPLITQASDWSLTKILTVNHVGSPSDNDGVRKGSFILENQLNSNRYLMMGITENSEARNGLMIGYSKRHQRSAKLETTRNIYVSSNYKKLPFLMPIPTFGVRYQVTPKIKLLAEAVPVPDPHAYVLVLTGVNVSF